MFFAAQLLFFQEKPFLENCKKIICIKTKSSLNPKTAKISYVKDNITKVLLKLFELFRNH